MIVCKLVKDGYDTLSGIKELNVEDVAMAFRNSKFLSEYETEFWFLNKMEKD